MELGECLVRLDWQTYDENAVRDEVQLRRAVLAALTGYAGVGTYDELNSLTDYELSQICFALPSPFQKGSCMMPYKLNEVWIDYSSKGKTIHPVHNLTYCKELCMADHNKCERLSYFIEREACVLYSVTSDDNHLQHYTNSVCNIVSF